MKRDLYSRFDLQYIVGMYGCEDQYTMCELLKNDITIAYLPKAYYHYMHYGNATQSRRYDESTYQHDVKMRDMFVELLDDTPYQQIAYDKKTKAIFSRAFYFGYEMYSSRAFKERFGKYSITKEDSFLMNCFFLLSKRGYYRLVRKMWGTMYSGKQLLKSLK